MHIDLGLGLGSSLISIGKRFTKNPNHLFALCCGSNDFALWLFLTPGKDRKTGVGATLPPLRASRSLVSDDDQAKKKKTEKKEKKKANAVK